MEAPNRFATQRLEAYGGQIKNDSPAIKAWRQDGIEIKAGPAVDFHGSRRL
jgi:hypothetical protein